MGLNRFVLSRNAIKILFLTKISQISRITKKFQIADDNLLFRIAQKLLYIKVVALLLLPNSMKAKENFSVYCKVECLLPQF